MASLSLQRILRRIFKAAELKQHLAEHFSGSSSPFSRPFITIAREPGSGGAPIGQALAKRLGFEYYDQELIDQIARTAKLRKEMVHEVDEKGRTAVQDFIHGLLNPEYVSDVTFVKHLTNVIVSLAYKGNVVILGRGACYLTPKDKGLHVRITAPLKTRLDRAVLHESHSLSKAKEIIREVGKDRREFIQQYFGRDIGNTVDYDLTINTEFLDVEDSVEIIVKAFERKFPSRLKKIF